MVTDTNKFFERLFLVIGLVATVFSCYVGVLALSRQEVREVLIPFIATSPPEIRQVPVTVIVERIVTATPSALSPAVSGSVDVAANQWTTSFGWKSEGELLINIGNNVDRNLPKEKNIFAPHIPTSANYTIEYEAQVLHKPECGSFGVILRSKYQVGIHLCDGEYIGIVKPNIQLRKFDNFDPGTTWHTYKVEIKQNTITVYIDGTQYVTFVDAEHSEPGKIGLWNDRTNVQIRKFTISEIPPASAAK